MKQLNYIVLLLIVPICIKAQNPAGPSGNWNMVFEDNFNGSSLDQSKWSYNYPWGSGHTHNHDAWCVAENVQVQNGLLVITAEDEKHPESTEGYDWTSGVITTSGKFHIDAGYIEGRFKASEALGTWPAFWTLGDGWPPEIDILEIPHERNLHHYYLHYGPDWQNEQSFGGTHTGPDKSAGFHTYGVEWDTDYMYFYFDGQRIATFNNRPEVAQAVNQYILINLAVGGWAGTPPADAQFPTTFECDWVRVWERDESQGIPNGDYRITPSHATNQALEVGNWGTTNGSNINQWSYWGGDLQQWTITNVDGEYYSIRPVGAPGQAMDVDSWSTANGANVMTWAYAGGTNQQFRFEPNNGGYTIHPRHSGKCLDISNASTENGANVMQWDCHGGANQTFLLTQLRSSEIENRKATKSALTVYPNPVSKETLTLSAYLDIQSEVKISIYNVQGMQVFTKNIGMHNTGELVHNLKVRNLPSGVYYLGIEYGNQVEKTMFVKQ